ncbi:MAG: energy transducer TonB [Candidatus Firestonebacteria bacterium]|nr:energy transducer TonB [Candidatus Firestonebacteria bacterium]
MSVSTYSIIGKKIKGDFRYSLLYSLLAVVLHLTILIMLNRIIIETASGQEEEQTIFVKNLPPADINKVDTPAGPVPKSLTRVGNTPNAGGGGGSKMMIDSKLLEKEIIDNSEKLRDMTLEDLQKILPEKGDEDLIKDNLKEQKQDIKERKLDRSKITIAQPVITLKKGYRFGIKGGKGTVRSFESALKAGLFGKPTGSGDGVGSGIGSGYGPGSGGGWGGGSGGGVGSGIGSGWQGGEGGRGNVDAIIKSDRIIKSTVRVFVLPDGSVDKVDLLKSSGFVELDTLAMDNARNNIYDPLELKPGEEEKLRIYDVEIEFSQIR